jgi:phosphoribosylglycinamide formyltransferase-1
MLGPAAVCVVISNLAGAAGLERARRAGIPTLVVESRGKAREAFDGDVVGALRGHGVEIVCLAGFMRIVSDRLLAAFPSRVLNIHPSLLPAFPGLDAQRQALEHGVKVTGATVHFVDSGLDSGPILIQEAVPVVDADTVETLAARILAVEHRVYPRAVRIVAEGRYRIDGRRVFVKEDGGGS